MVWRPLVDWARYLLEHREKTEKNSADIEEMHEEFDGWTKRVEQIAFELVRLRDNEAHEREMLALRIENVLLRERRLPPSPSDLSPTAEQLLRQIDDLKRENEELRKRLEQRDIE